MAVPNYRFSSIRYPCRENADSFRYSFVIIAQLEAFYNGYFFLGKGCFSETAAAEKSAFEPAGGL